MEQYHVSGMHCAACSARVEKAVSKVEGVTSCSVNLLTNSMSVEGNADPKTIMAAVKAAGYKASPDKKTASVSEKDEEFADTETLTLAGRFLISLFFLLILMYFSMGHMMWNWPLPPFFQNNYMAVGLTQLLLTVIIMVINRRFFINGFQGLIHKAPNMDTLVALGSSASFLMSTAALFMMSDAYVNQDTARIMILKHDFYFESASMILTLITLGKMLESHAKGKTTSALKSLIKLTPKTAVLLINGKETTVPIEQVKKGDIFLVRPGESIPADGYVLEGNGAVNESALTGESIPVDKETGDPVSAATINQSGFLKCEASRIGEDTTLSQIIRMVREASTTKAPIARIADKVSGIFVPVVMLIALITLIVWLLLGQTLSYALARAISVLVISCPCALGLATPVAIMVGSGLGAKNGILFKTAVSLEETGKAKIVVLDKTGTITQGEPRVTDICPTKGISENELLITACSLELKSEHPLAKAICVYGKEHSIPASEITDFTALPGNGLTGSLEGEKLYGGSFAFAQTLTHIPEDDLKKAGILSESGKTPLAFLKGNRFLGFIAVADTIRKDSPAAVKTLKKMGMHVVMLTGDNEKSARAIGVLAGVDEVIAGVLPDEKDAVIKDLKKKGKTIMVGDGINDALALVSADIGIAIGAGTDVAVDAADIVLMKNTLADVPASILLSRYTLRNIHENLFWAFIYNLIGIPLAAGVFVSLGLTLNPMFGAAAMSLSSFCVVTNALRLNFCKLYKNK